MALMPKRVKYRKQQRGKRRGEACRGNYVAFGDFGLQAMGNAWITARQIEAGRIAISHYLGAEGKYWVRVFPHKVVTGKPLEVRMGSGKGEPNFWCAVVQPGTILYEIGGVPDETAKSALARAAHKMPVKVRMTYRRASV